MNEKGMTLMELLVVVAMVATIAGIAMLNTGGLRQTYQVKAAAREVFGDMQRARLAAIRQGRVHRVCFFPGETAFTNYTVASGPGPDGDFCTDDDETVTSKEVSALFRGLAFAENFGPAGVNSATFKPTGTASSGNVEISSGGSAKQVKVNQYTGNVRIE